MSTEIQVRAAPSLEPTSIAEAIVLAKAAVASRLYSVQSPEAALMILLTGRDLRLTASQSLRAIYVVNGKPVVSADALVAAVRTSGLCASWRVLSRLDAYDAGGDKRRRGRSSGAIARYQAASGGALKADGVLGPKTFEHALARAT